MFGPRSHQTKLFWHVQFSWQHPSWSSQSKQSTSCAVPYLMMVSPSYGQQQMAKVESHIKKKQYSQQIFPKKTFLRITPSFRISFNCPIIYNYLRFIGYVKSVNCVVSIDLCGISNGATRWKPHGFLDNHVQLFEVLSKSNSSTILFKPIRFSTSLYKLWDAL